MIKVKHSAPWGTIGFYREQPKFTDYVLAAIILTSISVWTFPHAALAQSLEQEQSHLVFEMTNFLPHGPVYITPEVIEIVVAGGTEQVELPSIALGPEKPINPRVLLLEDYLREKKSPLAAHAETLLDLYHYRLIIGISFAESNFCRKQIKPHNCWGIGGGRPERYANYDEAVIRANNLIQKYHDLGMKNPKLMRNSWVGWQNDSWIVAVNMVTKELENRGL